MTLAMTPGERVRAAAISSRPTSAMNLTAGSAAAAGRGAAVSHATHAIAKKHAERPAAGSRNCHVDMAGLRLPITLDMLCSNPSVARFPTQWAAPRPLRKKHATNFDHERRGRSKTLVLAGYAVTNGRRMAWQQSQLGRRQVGELPRLRSRRQGANVQSYSLKSGSPITSSESRLSLMLWPLRMNLPCGMATTRPPKPRNPPVRTRSATILPLGPVLTARTSPIRVPSAENTLRPTRSCAAGVSEGLTAGAFGDGGAASGLGGLGSVVGGVTFSGGAAPGAGCAGACCADAARGSAATTARAHRRRRCVCNFAMGHAPVLLAGRAVGSPQRRVEWGQTVSAFNEALRSWFLGSRPPSEAVASDFSRSV